MPLLQKLHCYAIYCGIHLILGCTDCETIGSNVWTTSDARPLSTKMPSGEECVMWSSVILPTDQLWAVCSKRCPAFSFPCQPRVLIPSLWCLRLHSTTSCVCFVKFCFISPCCFLKSTTSFQAPVLTWSMPLPQSFGKPKFRRFPKKDFLKLRFLWVNNCCSLGNFYIPKYNRWLHSLLEI